MKVKELFYRRKITGRSVVAIVGIFLALRYSKECYRGMENGVNFCLEVLIPSLFFFMVVAAYITQSGIAEVLCRPLGGIARRLFKLPASAISVILLSIIGGYPVGGTCAAILCKEKRLSSTEASKTAYIAVAAGPGFLVSYIGGTLLNNVKAGYVLLGAQIIAVILTGVIVGHTVDCEPLPHSATTKPCGNNLLVNAVQSASRAAFGMCAMVVIFCALTEILDTVVTDRTVCDIASAILEITNGCNRISDHVPLYVTAFFVGFGGLSVHFQIFAALGDIPIRKGLFFLYRIIEGIIAMCATYIYLMIDPMTTAVFHTTTLTPSAARSATVAGSAALVISSLLFIASVTKRSVLVHHPKKLS